MLAQLDALLAAVGPAAGAVFAVLFLDPASVGALVPVVIDLALPG